MIGPGLSLARWSDKDESKIMLLAVKDKKPVEIGSELNKGCQNKNAFGATESVP